MEIVTIIYLVLIFISLYLLFFFVILILKNKDKMFASSNRKRDYEISIVIPCYNEEKSIEETLKTLLKSDYPRLKKIIVVDDCSTDNSYNVIKN